MTTTAATLPAGPGASSGADALSFENLSRRFKDPYAFRYRFAVMLGLSKLGWSVFGAIWHHLWGATRAWPTQATIQIATGCSERSVRYATRELEAAGIVVTKRVPRAKPKGGFRNHYLPGPALLEMLTSLAKAQDAKKELEAEGFEVLAERPKVLSRAPRASGTPCRAHPARVADDPSPNSYPSRPCFTSSEPAGGAYVRAASPKKEGCLDLSEDEPESLEGGEPPSPLVPSFTRDDAEAASLALVAWHRIRWPDARPPKEWSVHEHALIAECMALVSGSVETKAGAANMALRHAFATAKTPPTLRYVFGSAHYFLTHVEKGVALRAEVEAVERSMRLDAERRRLTEERTSAAGEPEGVEVEPTDGEDGSAASLPEDVTAPASRGHLRLVSSPPAPPPPPPNTLGDTDAGRILDGLRAVAREPQGFSETWRRHLLTRSLELFNRGEFGDHADEIPELRRVTDSSIKRTIVQTRRPPTPS